MKFRVPTGLDLAGVSIMGVKVKRERPDQRRHHRVTAPLYVALDEFRVRATDWSLGGFRVDNYPGPLPNIGDELPLTLSLPFQGFEVTFECKAEVVRDDEPTAMFACRFTELGEREREVMQHFIEELVRGAMVDVQDTIQRRSSRQKRAPAKCRCAAGRSKPSP
jgi:hypothetical protein